MSKSDLPNVDQTELVNEWDRVMPTVLQPGDATRVWADEGDSSAIRVHIQAAGHTGYSFDFKVTYVDAREVKVELTDVQQGTTHIDERGDVVQSLIDDYVRHIHECAQALQKVTNA
ncbi:hypothetical protein D3C85_1219470 [compost metagenome]